MAKKGDRYYFDNFVACVECSQRAATLLGETLKNYSKEDMGKKREQIHEIEHEADRKKHELMNMLNKAFITPIEREDIVSLAQNLDDITDTIEDVFLRIYICNVDAIKENAIAMTDLVISACEALKVAMEEFPEFRKSTKLKEYLIRINDLEEKGDELYIEGMRALHTDGEDALTVIAWRDIYSYLERCMDACEHAADIVEAVIMKNS
ncbi:MAG: DUF47 domain-containing protein [Lachnospiraceae bacterium]|nr:DUF47 domain-containing protein [Lachnospiraceae bacterium]